jgi:hypothetical protein
VTVTFSLAFKQVAATHPAAAELLQFSALEHTEGSPEEVVTQGAPELGEVLGSAASHRREWIKTRAEACRYALLGRDSATRTLTLHRVVQAVLQDEINEDTQRCWAERAVRALVRGFPKVDEFATWPQCERLLPHALAGAAWIAQWEFNFAETVYLLNQTGYYLHSRGRYAEAEPLSQRALAIREQTLSPEHPSTLLCVKIIKRSLQPCSSKMALFRPQRSHYFVKPHTNIQISTFGKRLLRLTDRL